MIMTKHYKKNINLSIRNSILEENIRIELNNFLNERRRLDEGILSQGYNILKNMSKKTLRILWEATKFVFKNIRNFFKTLAKALLIDPADYEYTKGNKITNFLVNNDHVITISILVILTTLYVTHTQQDVQQENEKIISKIKESENVMTISFDDKEKIEKLCKLDEVKIFALETEDNYLCLPFDDEKSFKVIKTADYYNSYFNITDEESKDILDILIEHKEKGTKRFKKKIGNTPAYDYIFVAADSEGSTGPGAWAGIHKPETSITPGSISIREHFHNYSKDLNYASMYSTFVHEFIHYKDNLLKHKKFTNDIYQDAIYKLGKSLKKDQIVSYKEIGEILKIEDMSSVRYICSILQKNNYIDYVDNNFTKVKINFLPGYTNVHADTTEGQYFYSPIELNTHFNNTVQDILQDINNSLKNQEKIFDPLFIINKTKKADSLNDIVKFNNKQILRMRKAYEKNRENNEFLKELKDFKSYIFNNQNSTKFDVSDNKNKQHEKNLKVFLNSPLVKMMEYTESEKDDLKAFLFKMRFADNKTLYFTLHVLFDNFEQSSIQNFIDEYQTAEQGIVSTKMKNNIIKKNVTFKVNQIFNEIIKRNKKEFKNEQEKNKFYNELFNNYNEKVQEKLKDYEQNLETNKEAYGKLKESILRNYIRQLII